MSKNILFAVAIVFSPNLFAIGDFSGHWVAEHGEVVSQIGLNSQCSRVEIIIEQTPTAVITKKYTSTCDLYGSSWGPVEQTVMDGKVYEHGEHVGTVDETSLISLAPSGTVAYHYNLHLVSGPNGEIELESEYGAQNFLGTLMTVARLKRQ